MKKKIILCVCCTVACVLSVVSAALLIQNSDPVRLKASGTNLTLAHGDADSLTNEYNDGIFTTKTGLGANADWEYNYAKSSTGLIDLGKNKVGISDVSHCYIGNTSPITSISEMTVTFSGGVSAYLYGSSDSEEYYLADILTSGVSTDRIAGYLYFRIVNANQDTSPLTINDISIEYGCVSSDYSDEPIDITSHSVLSDAGSVLSNDTATYKNGFRSSQSLKIASTSQSNDWVISLNHSYTGAEIKKATLSFYINSKSNDNYDASHTYVRFLIYPAKGTSRNTTKAYL